MLNVMLNKGPAEGPMDMSQMRKGQLAVIEHKHSTNNGEIVMRTNSSVFCVFSLDRAEHPGQCWTGGAPTVKVRPLKTGDVVTITVG